MTVLPVAERELRAAARRPGSYWSRLIAALAAIGIAAWITYFERQVSSSQLGGILFSGLSGLIFVVALFAGAGFTADSISMERREGTLGLLFLTDLKSWDVITGKLAASSLGAFYGLVAVMPVLAIPLLLGGVTGTEYVRVLVTVLNTLLWSLSAGLFISTFHNESRTSVNQAIGLVFAGAALCPAIGGITGAWLSNRGIDDDSIKYLVGPLICISPGAAFAGSFQSSYSSEPLLFYISNGVVALGSFFLLKFAGKRLPRCWQNSSVQRTSSRIAGMIDSEANQQSATSAFRTRLLEISPFVWLVCRRWWRRNTPWLFIICTLVAYVTMGLWVGADWWAPPSYVGLSAFLHLIFKLWIAGEAPRQVFEDRKSGAMELMLTLPLTDRDFIDGHMKALRDLFMKPLFAVIAIDLVVFAVSLSQMNTWGDNGQSEWILTWVMREWFLVVDVIALAVVGLRHGSATNRNKAQGYPFFMVIIVPWLIIAALGTVVFSPAARSGGGSTWSFSASLCVWWTVGTVASVFLAFNHWHRLQRDFRNSASARPGEKRVVTPQA